MNPRSRSNRKARLPIPLSLVFLFLLWAPFTVSASNIEPSDSAYQEFLKLKQLKESDPAAYQQAVQTRRQKIQERVSEWKTREPEKYQTFLKHQNQERVERMKTLREKDPQAFQKIRERRVQRIEQFQKKNPEAFQRWVERHPQAREQLKRFESRRLPMNEVKGDRPQTERGPQPEKRVSRKQHSERIPNADRPPMAESSRYPNQPRFQKNEAQPLRERKLRQGMLSGPNALRGPKRGSAEKFSGQPRREGAGFSRPRVQLGEADRSMAAGRQGGGEKPHQELSLQDHRRPESPRRRERGGVR